MKMKTLIGLALAGVFLTSACQDLDITNPNNPDRARALTNPADVEALVYGSWGRYPNRTHRAWACFHTLPQMADEVTSTFNNNAALELSSEPRAIYNNAPTALAQEVGRWQWYDWYEMLTNANDALTAIEGGMTISDGGGDRTQQVMAIAKFLQGIALGQLGLLFDQASVVTEDTDLDDPKNLEFRPYAEVLDQAVASLEEAIDLATGQSWVVQNLLEGRSMDASTLVHASHSFIVKYRVYGARTREERAALPWAELDSHIDQGIDALGEDFWVDLDPNGFRSYFRYRMQLNASFSQRADYYTIGMADVSGAFQDWWATPLNDRTKFYIESPDRRIVGPDGPTSDGKYFEYHTREWMSAERGTYHRSYYQFDRFNGDNRGGPLCPDCVLEIITLDEMRLIRAESAMYQGNNGLAADLINVTRTENGELPPVMVSGVPQAAGCVPKAPTTGQCGDLELALYYERQIELFGLDCIRGWADRRGFGMLTPGTILDVPVPGRELSTLGLPIYTFGGVGGTNASTGWALW